MRHELKNRLVILVIKIIILTKFVKMKNTKMKEIGKLIRELREKEGYPLRKVSEAYSKSN